jgi:hypothetical protein
LLRRPICRSMPAGFGDLLAEDLGGPSAIDPAHDLAE